MKAILLLEDGTKFEGKNFGAEGEVVGNLVFHTGVVGYQEILTDPAYRGTLVCLSYPLIGNYGINEEGFESDRAQAGALIVKENSRMFSNWKATGSLSDFMHKHKVIGLEGIDTQELVSHIRDQGECHAILSTRDFDEKSLKAKLRSPQVRKLVQEVTCPKMQTYKAQLKAGMPHYRAVLIDLGGNLSFMRMLSENGFEIIRVPYNTDAKTILEQEPDVVVLSPGPGNPESLPEVVMEVREILGKKPIFGAVLGHLVLGLALGARVSKMKCGHHGVNHPVMHLHSDRGEITSQAHSYVIAKENLGSEVEVTHENLNDKTVEGIRGKKYPAAGLQFFPSNLEMVLGMVRK